MGKIMGGCATIPVIPIKLDFFVCGGAAKAIPADQGKFACRMLSILKANLPTNKPFPMLRYTSGYKCCHVSWSYGGNVAFVTTDGFVKKKVIREAISDFLEYMTEVGECVEQGAIIRIRG